MVQNIPPLQFLSNPAYYILWHFRVFLSSLPLAASHENERHMLSEVLFDMMFLYPRITPKRALEHQYEKIIIKIKITFLLQNTCIIHVLIQECMCTIICTSLLSFLMKNLKIKHKNEDPCFTMNELLKIFFCLFPTSCYFLLLLNYFK